MEVPNASSDDANSEPLALPVYGVEGWATVTGFVVSRGMTVLNEDGHELSSAISVRQVNGEGRIEVTSYRRERHSIEELRGWTVTKALALSSASGPQGGPADDLAVRSAGPAERAWTPVIIRVDDVPTDFAVVSVDDGWAAVGKGPSSTIAIAARKIALGEFSLVRLPASSGRHRRPSRARPPRARSFPPEALTAPEDAFGPPNVELVYADDRLIGIYQDLAIDLELHVPHSHSRTSGRFAGSDVAATWQLGNNSCEHPDVRSSLHGRFADRTVTATGTFHLDEDWAIDSAVITGHVGNQAIEVAVTAIDGGFNSTSTVAIDGHCAESTFALAVTISGDLRHGIIVGAVDNLPVRLDARRRSGQSRRTELTGRYQGPPVLLAFIAPTLLHFI